MAWRPFQKTSSRKKPRKLKTLIFYFEIFFNCPATLSKVEKVQQRSKTGAKRWAKKGNKNVKELFPNINVQKLATKPNAT